MSGGLDFCLLHPREVRDNCFHLMANYSFRDSKPQLRKRKVINKNQLNGNSPVTLVSNPNLPTKVAPFSLTPYIPT